MKFFIHNEFVINDDLRLRWRGCTQISLISQINLDLGWMCHDLLCTIPIYFYESEKKIFFRAYKCVSDGEILDRQGRSRVMSIFFWGKLLRPLQIDYLVDGFINETRESGGSMNIISTFFYIIVGLILLSTEACAEYI